MKGKLRKVVIRKNHTDEYYGYFHQWGAYEHGEYAITCAIVENLNGEVFYVKPYDVIFIETFPA